MQLTEHFILFDNIDEFRSWLVPLKISRRISILQVHHTWMPNYRSFDGRNHFALAESMRRSHIGRGFDDIAQQLTTYPDGKLLYSVGRPFDKVPAGIKGVNAQGICIEHLGNFDIGGDKMTEAHKNTIIGLYAILCKKFNVPADSDHIVYHHWYDLNTGERKNGKGSTKSCPGTNFFNAGNEVDAAKKSFIPLVVEAMKKYQQPETKTSPPAPTKEEVIKEVMKNLSRFYSDIEASWAVNSIDSCTEKGLFAVPADKKFHPTNNITRQELAVVLQRVVDYILENKG